MFSKENYKVLFIINKSMNDEDDGKPVDIISTERFLKKKGLKNLAIRENIINCNLVESKSFKGYGINTIFKRIFDILVKENQFYNDETLYIKLKKCLYNINQTLNIKGKEKELEQYKNESNLIQKDISDKNELFKEYAGDENIMNKLKKKANFDKNIYIAITSSNAFIPIPYSDLALTPVLQANFY